MTPEDMTPEERAQDCFEAVAAALGHWPPLEAKEHILTTVRDAILSERERCAKLVEGYDPDRVYHSDADGNEFPAGIDWDLTQSCLAKYIREGT